MLYASSKDALKKGLSGINEEYQATECACWSRQWSGQLGLGLWLGLGSGSGLGLG